MSHMNKDRINLKAFYKANTFQRLVPIILILILWIYITEAKLIDPLFVPGPRDIVKSYISLWPMLPKAIVTSLSMIALGFLIGSAFGIISSLIMAYSKVCLNIFGSIFDVLRPIPVFALIPMFVLWFGIGMTPQVALIALGCSVSMGVTTSEAIRNIPNIYIHASYTLGANRMKVFTTIVCPYIVPHLVGAIRLSATLSFGLDVAAEFMGSQTGLGYLMIVQQQYLRTSGIFAIVLLYSLFAIIADKLIALLEQKVTLWTDRSLKTNALK